MTATAQYRFFKSTLKPWDMLFADAAEFASQVGKENLISISHSEDQNNGVITVWYWGRGEARQTTVAGQTPAPRGVPAAAAVVQEAPKSTEESAPASSWTCPS